jgi:uncharacterized protein (TIGR02117 family)
MVGFGVVATDFMKMTLTRMIFKWTLRSAGLFGLVLALYALGYWLVPKFGNGVQPRYTEGEITIYLLRSGVHTDIVVPWNQRARAWSKVFSANVPSDTMVNYVAIGWGHRKFYMETPTWADLTVENVLSATFGVGETALHVRNIYEPIEGVDCRKIEVNVLQYQSLCEYINRTAIMNQDAAISIEQLQQPHDVYYEADGHYHAFRTCNTWVSDALWAAQIYGPWWTASTEGLFLDE